MSSDPPHLMFWERWLGQCGSLRIQLIAWNVLALTVLLAVLGTVIRQTVHSFLMASVNGELQRQVQRVRLPPPRPDRGPRPDGPEQQPAFNRLGERRIAGRENFPNPSDSCVASGNCRALFLHQIRCDELQGPPLALLTSAGRGGVFPVRKILVGDLDHRHRPRTVVPTVLTILISKASRLCPRTIVRCGMLPGSRRRSKGAGDSQRSLLTERRSGCCQTRYASAAL